MRSFPIFVFSALLSVWSCQSSESQSSQADATSQTDVPAAPRPPRDQVIEEPGFASPESVIGDGTFFYVSNVGVKLEPSKKDGDGYISQLDSTGKIINAKWIQGLDAPKGSAIVDGTFYVADIDKIKFFDLSTGEKKGEIDFSSEGVAFLNDLVAGPSGTLFASATDKSRIYRVNLADGTFAQIETDKGIVGQNGLYFDAKANHLYVCSFIEGNTGKAARLDLSQSPAAVTSYTDHLGLLDGIVKIESYLVVSDWNTQSLVILDLDQAGKKVGEHPMSVRIQGPADFYYDERTKEFWVPGMQMNKLFVKSSAIQ